MLGNEHVKKFFYLRITTHDKGEGERVEATSVVSVNHVDTYKEGRRDRVRTGTSPMTPEECGLTNAMVLNNQSVFFGSGFRKVLVEQLVKATVFFDDNSFHSSRHGSFRVLDRGVE
jgi:hypothetical protein